MLLFFAIFFQCLLDFAQNLPEFCQNSPKFAGIQNPDASRTHPESGRIRKYPGRIRDASGIGTSSAGVCIWPIHPLLASCSARPAAALRDLFTPVGALARRDAARGGIARCARAFSRTRTRAAQQLCRICISPANDFGGFRISQICLIR